MRYLLVLGIAVFIYACGTSKATVPTSDDLTRAQAAHPEYTMEDLQEGRRLYTTYCGSCHPLKKPASRDEQDWRQIVPSMAGKANKKAKSEVITAAGTEQIIRYLTAMGTIQRN
ncbi:MAG: hypothetical protein RL226_542 [Bacteroidota bacterium]|jgi:mono/diheme cytochrome c family protein